MSCSTATMEQLPITKTQRTTTQNLMNLVKISFTLSFCIFNWDSLHARLSSHCKEWSCKKMNHKKIKAYRKHVQKETIVERSLLILDLKLFRSQVNRKYSQRIPGSSCARKKTVDIDILVTSMNDGDRKLIFQNNKQTSLKNKEVEPVEPVLMNFYQSSTTGKTCRYNKPLQLFVEKRQFSIKTSNIKQASK